MIAQTRGTGAAPGPTRALEINAIANSLETEYPPISHRLSQLNAARLRGEPNRPDQPELAIPLAIQSGDFDEAARLIDDLKSDDTRKIYTQMLLRLQAKSLLSKSDVAEPWRKFENRKITQQDLFLYLEAIKVAQKKEDPALSRSVIDEARTLIPQVDRNGLHVRTLLSFAAQSQVLASLDEAIDFLDAAVLAINALPKPSDQTGAMTTSVEMAWAELNDPRSLVESMDLAQAFSAIARFDLERAIIEGRKIVPKSVQLVARLEAAGEILRIDARKVKRQPRIKGVASSQ